MNGNSVFTGLVKKLVEFFAETLDARGFRFISLKTLKLHADAINPSEGSLRAIKPFLRRGNLFLDPLELGAIEFGTRGRIEVNAANLLGFLTERPPHQSPTCLTINVAPSLPEALTI